MSGSDLSEDEFKDESNLTDEQLQRKQGLLGLIRAGLLNDDEIEGRFGEKQPKISLKQRIVERSKETGAALKSKLKDFHQKRKRREGDEKHQSQPSAEAADKPSDMRVFGVPISLAIERSKLCNEIELPTVFRLCIEHLEQEGLSHEGIYRVSGVKSRIEAVKTQFDQGQVVDFEPLDINTITGALKLYLRELPEPILTTQQQLEFENAGREKNVGRMSELVSQLPTGNRLMIRWLLLHMKHIAENSVVNKMSGPNLIIVFSPTLHISQSLLNFMFQNVDQLVGDTRIERYDPSEAQPAGRRSLRLMSTSEISSVDSSVVSREMKRLSGVLRLIHTELQSGQLTDDERGMKEDEIWSVQRILTQLNRRNRQMKGMARSLSAEDDISAERGQEQEETFDELSRQVYELRVECKELEQVEKQLCMEIDQEEATIDQLKGEINELQSNLPESYPILAHPDTAELDLSGYEGERQIINHLHGLIKDLLEERDQFVVDLALEQDVCTRLRTEIRMAGAQEAS